MKIENLKSFSPFKKISIAILIIIVALFCVLAFKIGSVITVVGINESSLSFWEKVAALLPLSDFKKDPNRLDILILGIRGEGDPNAGLLSDMIMLASYKKNTGQLALISIPRDLYVDIPDLGKKERLNFAYAYGESKQYGGGGLILSKRIISHIVGLDIDYAVSIDFKAFREIVDILGGVTIYRDRPFIEDLQWQGEGVEGSPFWYKKTITDEKTGKEKEIWALHVPEGKSTLDGTAALYYVRSRFTTSDFDRCRRQQEVILALKEKALSLNVLTNPLKIIKISDSLKRNLKMDIPAEEIFNFIEIANDSKIANIKRRVFDTTAEGLLYETHSPDGSYILLPAGNNFDKIKEACRIIFE